jgi:hypothetical protein
MTETPPNADTAWQYEVERLLGVLPGNMDFWREYHTSVYLHAAVTVLRKMVIEPSRDGGWAAHPSPVSNEGRGAVIQPRPSWLGFPEIAEAGRRWVEEEDGGHDPNR